MRTATIYTSSSKNYWRQISAGGSMGCPMYDELKEQIIEKVKGLGVENVDVELTFDPPWDKEMMSEEAKLVFKYLF